MKEPCRRKSGNFRAYFRTRENAEAYAADPANWPTYQGDVAHLCHCGFWHLSKLEWLEPQFTNADAQMLEEMGIEGPAKFADFKCSVCGAPMREGIYYLIMPNGSIRCETACGPEVAR
jgi:hypothetical protein